MQVVYNGPHPEVVVDELSQEQVITAGQPVEIPDDLATRLLEQDTWHPADKASQKVQDQIDSAAPQAVEPAQATEPSSPAPDAATEPQDAPQGTSSEAPTPTEGNS